EPDEASAGEPAAGLVNLDSIGSIGKPFSGTFDGNNKTISGLYMYQGHEGLGFIGNAKDAVIKNVILRDACVINMNTKTKEVEKDGATTTTHDCDDDDRFGILVGLIESGSTTIENCIVEGVAGSAAAYGRNTTYEYIGGLIGRCDAATTAKNCVVLARIYGSGAVICKKTDTNVLQTNVSAYDAKTQLTEGIAAIDAAVAAARQ
ncbi:MAG: hypothetical protein J6Z17_01160, partial [Treponema sp.]|nr:hypothetical protein [Treponema sp.]